MPFPLDMYTTRPANGATAPERHGFLDGGPANRDVAASTAPGTPEQSPIRYLGRRTYRLSPSSNADTTVPPNNFSTIAQAPDDDGPLTLNEAYLQYRKRLDASQSQVSAFDTSAPAAPLAPSYDSAFSGGLVGRLTALMKQYPEIYGPVPQDDELPAYDRWTRNG
jgi:hypothetical protein